MADSTPMRTVLSILVVCLACACVDPRRSTMAHPAPASVQPQTQPTGLWSFRFVEAMLPEFKGGGLPWDSDGTQPDPFVRLVIDGRTVWESPVQQNTRNPHWNVTLPR